MKKGYLFILLSLGLSMFFGCQEAPLYKKTFTDAEKAKLPMQMMHKLLGRYYQGSVGERMVLEEALVYDTTNAKTWRELGVPYLKRGFAAEYDLYYRKAVVYDGVQWQGWRGYIYLYFYRDYERAIKGFDALDALTPNFVDYPQATSVHYMRAVAYLKLGQYDKAISYWDKHFKEELKATTGDYIDPKAYLLEAITYWEKGDKIEARKRIDNGLKNRPKNANLWYWSAKMHLEEGRLAAAKRDLKKAVMQFEEGYFNYRPYVEEFYQTYESDLLDLEQRIERR